jgi:hypothetical protein
MSFRHASSLFCLLVVGIGYAHGDTPPVSDVGLSDVLKMVEKAGYDAVTEVSFDDGRWEVEALKDKQPVELKIDPVSLKVIDERPDESHHPLKEGSTPLSAIVDRLQKAGFNRLRKAEFEVTGWEVEAFHDASWRELMLSIDGEILPDVSEN